MQSAHDYPKKQSLAQFLKEPAAFGFNLLSAALDLTDFEIVSWDPTTIQLEMKMVYGVDIPDDNFDRLCAALQILKTDQFWHDPEFFCKACRILSFEPVDDRNFIPPDLDSVAWGCAEALLICPDLETGVSAQIKKLIRHTARIDGIDRLPKALAEVLEAEKDTRIDFAEAFETHEDASAAWEGLDKHVEEVDGLVDERITALLKQLSELPLSSGQAGVAQDLLRKLETGK